MPNILILLLLFTNSISSYGAEGIVKVAVVHSYTSEFKWTSKIEKGFFVKLGSELPFQIVYRGELDAKRNPQGVRSRAGIIKSD